MNTRTRSGLLVPDQYAPAVAARPPVVARSYLPPEEAQIAVQAGKLATDSTVTSRDRALAHLTLATAHVFEAFATAGAELGIAMPELHQISDAIGSAAQLLCLRSDDKAAGKPPLELVKT